MRKSIKYLSVALTVCFLFLSLPLSVNVSAAFADPAKLDGIRNIDLTYTFAPASSSYGRQTVESLLQDVGYYDKSGKIVDTFMDAYLFLPCVQRGPSGGTMYESDDPAVASDWIAYLDDLFLKGYNVDALNTAVDTVGKALGKKDYKVKIFFTILFPHDGQKNFGSLDGKTSLNFSKQDDRMTAIKWLMNEEIRRFKAGNYTHLELEGFYWFEEFISNDTVCESFVKSFNQYAHENKYKTIWIPYYHATGYNKWKSFGFDVCCMQPNLMWMQDYDRDRVANCLKDCDRLGMSMEMEMDNNAMTSKYNRFLSYIREGVRTGANLSVNMYYMNGAYDVLYHAKNSKEEQGRSVYDLTYQYAKGKLKLEDIPPEPPSVLQLPEGYKWVSDYMSYVATPPYLGDGSQAYMDVNYKELTDGIFSDSIWTTAWHAFHITQMEEDETFEITINLGSKKDNIGCAMLEFGQEVPAGVDIPPYVDISVSTDGKNFTDVGRIKNYVNEGEEYWAILEFEPCTARLIRAKFPLGTKNFVFCSEFKVGQKELVDDTLYGDLDGDGKLSSKDYVILKRLVLGTLSNPEKYRAVADVNRDGSIGSKDYIYLKRKILHTI